jgi:hypothetical protein
MANDTVIAEIRGQDAATKHLVNDSGYLRSDLVLDLVSPLVCCVADVRIRSGQPFEETGQRPVVAILEVPYYLTP